MTSQPPSPNGSISSFYGLRGQQPADLKGMADLLGVRQQAVTAPPPVSSGRPPGPSTSQAGQFFSIPSEASKAWIAELTRRLAEEEAAAMQKEAGIQAVRDLYGIDLRNKNQVSNYAQARM